MPRVLQVRGTTWQCFVKANLHRYFDLVIPLLGICFRELLHRSYRIMNKDIHLTVALSRELMMFSRGNG